MSLENNIYKRKFSFSKQKPKHNTDKLKIEK